MVFINISMKRKYKQGIYIPINPSKFYITKTFDMKEICIKYRSSYEYKFLVFCDMNPDIIKVNSEGLIIPYYNPITNKKSKYYMDFVVKNKKGVIFIVEVKPYSQTIKPKPPKNSSAKSRENYDKAIETFIVNSAKWESAREFARNNKCSFMIVSEETLGIKVR